MDVQQCLLDGKSNDLLHLHRFLDQCIDGGTGKMFNSKPIKSAQKKKSMKKIQGKLKAAVVELCACKLGEITVSSCQLYEAIIYKFGPSNRHQKFWRTALQVYKLLKSLNKEGMVGPFSTLSEKLGRSNLNYSPTKRAVTFLGALLLRRILQLDKLRLICARSADLSMGFIELRHLLTFNLMSVALVSDIARQALRHMRQLAQIYATLSDWFRKHSNKFPLSVDASMLKSVYCDLDATENAQNCLKEHDLTILRREIEGIGRSDLEDLSSSVVQFAMNNQGLERFYNKRQKMKNIKRYDNSL